MKSKAADGFMSISPDCGSDRIIIGELKKLLIAILAAAGLALGADPFFFIQASDPQFGMYTANRNFVQETGNWEFTIANVNRLHPAFLVVTGDLTNKGGDPAQIAEYKRINAKLDPAIHIYSVPGNHDVENEPTPQSLRVYRAAYGADYYSFREGAVYGIVLDSSLFKAPGNVSAEAAKQADEPDQYFNIPIETRRRALALLHRYGVRYVFAGHYHRNSLGREGELEMITTGPAGMPIGPDPSGLRIAEVNNGTIAHKYYGFGTLPATIPEKPSQP
jgi:predicted phosphodiesterase